MDVNAGSGHRGSRVTAVVLVACTREVTLRRPRSSEPSGETDPGGIDQPPDPNYGGALESPRIQSELSRPIGHEILSFNFEVGQVSRSRSFCDWKRDQAADLDSSPAITPPS